MLRQVKLTNYRRFKSFTVKLGSGNIFVGPNNSGKSSILDAFRILAACLRHAKARNPSLLEIDGKGVFHGYEVPETVFPFSLANITHDYGNEDAILEFVHKNGTRAVIMLHPDRTSRFFLEDAKGRISKSSTFRAAFLVSIVNIPTLAPFEAEEKVVEDETLHRNMSTRLASRVFRNYWWRQSESDFLAFKDEVESAWPGIEIKKPETVGYPSIMQMFYSENRIDREVQWSGFGFQVWMLIYTHFARAQHDSILVIDEPDVYLHPDLQRRLVGRIREKFAQFAMATHAIEIINEAEGSELISVDPNLRTGRRVTSDNEFTTLYQYIGSGSNADFARVMKSRKVIFVEGKDKKIIRKLARKFNLKNLEVSQNVPIIQLGGFSEWRRAVNAVWAFKNILNIDIEAFCLFDRDYRSDAQVLEFGRTTSASNLRITVFRRKEIENYLCDVDIISKAVARKGSARGRILSSAEIEALIALVTDRLRSDVHSQRIGHELACMKALRPSEDTTTTIRRANTAFEELWTCLESRLKVVSGKEFISEFNRELEEAGVGALTQTMLIDQMDSSHDYDDLKRTLTELEEFVAA